MRRFLRVFVTFTLILGILTQITACGTIVDDGIDKNDKRQAIPISLYSGGFGTEWLDAFCADFNETSKDFRFTRTGDNKNTIAEITQFLKSGVADADIYFVDEANMRDLLQQADKYLMDLSDVLNSTVEGETRMIKDKIRDYEMFEGLYSNGKGNIYAMPFTEATAGMIYDHDYFVENDLLLRDAQTSNGLSKGIDGKEGTYDDGLPSTEREFTELFDSLLDFTNSPVIFSEAIATGIIEPIGENILAKYLGEESYNTTFTFNGQFSTGRDTKTTITPTTGYKIWSEHPECFNKAFKFTQDILLNDKYLGNNEGLSHTDAQGKFIMSHAKENSRSVILYSGFWWENESRRHFSADANRKGEQWGYGKRDFRILPIPNLDGQSKESDGKNYLTAHRDGMIFVKKQTSPEKIQAIKEFLKAFASDKHIIDFTKRTNNLLSYDVEIPEDIKKGMTPFGRNLLEVHQSPNTVILHPNMMQMIIPISDDGIGVSRWHVEANKQTKDWLYYSVNSFTYDQFVEGIKTTYTKDNWPIK